MLTVATRRLLVPRPEPHDVQIPRQRLHDSLAPAEGEAGAAVGGNWPVLQENLIGVAPGISAVSQPAAHQHITAPSTAASPSKA